MENISNDLVTLNVPNVIVEEHPKLEVIQKPKCMMMCGEGKLRRKCRKNAKNGEYCIEHFEKMNEEKEENEGEFKKCECDEALIYAKCLYNMHLVYCSKLEKLYEGEQLMNMKGFCDKIKHNKEEYIDAYKQLYKSNKKEFKKVIKPEDMLKYLVQRDMMELL
jgi:hypothetical protein